MRGDTPEQRPKLITHQTVNTPPTSFLLMASEGKLEMMQRLLDKDSARYITKRDPRGNTALLLAAKHGHLQTVRWLLRQEGVHIEEENYRGETALILAIQQNHEFMVEHLKNERAHQQLLVELAKQQHPQEHHRMEQLQLTQRLRELTEPNPTLIACEKIAFYFDQLGTFRSDRPVGQLKTHLKPLLTKAQYQAVKRQRHPLLALLHAAFPAPEQGLGRKDIKKRIEILGKLLRAFEAQQKKSSPKHLLVFNALVRLHKLYRAAEQHVKTSPTKKNDQPRATLNSESLPTCYLTAEAAEKLASTSDEIIPSEITQGTHIVKILNGIYFKWDPYAPGVEFMVDKLYRILVGSLSAATELVKTKRGKRTYNYIASKAVIGETLKFILEAHPEYLEKIDDENFSAMVVLGILTDPEDYKPDNLMAKFTVNHEGKPVKLRIKGIDNDRAFTDPVVIQGGDGPGAGTHFIKVKNILYFLPQMQNKISPSFRNAFLQRQPERILIEWLQALYEKNQMYDGLLKRGVFSQTDYSGDPKSWREGLQLPIKLVQGTSGKLYQKLCKIQRCLQEIPEITLQELLYKLEPILQRCYEAIQRQHPNNPLDCLHILYRRPMALTVEALLELEHASPHQRNAILSELAHRTTTAQEFEESRDQSIQAATEEFIETIDFSNLEPLKQQLVFASLGALSFIERLTLTRSSALNDRALLQLLNKLPRLCELVLWGCSAVRVEDLLVAAAEHPQLTLVLDDQCQQLGPSEWARLRDAKVSFILESGGQRFPIQTDSPTVLLYQAFSCRPCSLPLLQFFVDSGADVVSKSDSHTPLYGYTPLHIAAKQGLDDAVEYLLSLGVDVNALDGSGATALDKAVKYDKAVVAERLRKAGGTCRHPHTPDTKKTVASSSAMFGLRRKARPKPIRGRRRPPNKSPSKPTSTNGHEVLRPPPFTASGYSKLSDTKKSEKQKFVTEGGFPLSPFPKPFDTEESEEKKPVRKQGAFFPFLKRSDTKKSEERKPQTSINF